MCKTAWTQRIDQNDKVEEFSEEHVIRERKARLWGIRNERT